MVKYYHGTTLREAESIKESGEFTMGTLIKDKKIAQKYAKRNTDKKLGGGGVLLEFEVDKDFGKAVDVGKKFKSNIKKITFRKVKGWRIK